MGHVVFATIRACAEQAKKKQAALPDINEITLKAREVMGSYALFDDCLSIDPTKVAIVRVQNELYRYAPGTTERPIADLNRALRLSTAVDEHLERKFGFGIINVVRVLVKYADYCIERQISTWQATPDIKLRTPLSIPEQEIQICVEMLHEDPLQNISFTPKDLLALDWMTLPAASANLKHGQSGGPAGRWIRYRPSSESRQDYWLPVNLVPIVLVNAVTELVQALKRNKDARRALRISAADAVLNALSSFKSPIQGPIPEEFADIPLSGNSIEWLVPIPPKTLFAISLAIDDELDRNPEFIPASIRLKERVQALEDGESISVKVGTHYQANFTHGVQIIPILVISSKSHLSSMVGQKSLFFSLEDLQWISQDSSSLEDFFRFCADISSDDFPDSFGFEMIDYWETWKANGKAFWPGALKADFLIIEPHQNTVEWDRAVKASPVEVALHSLQFPPLRIVQRLDLESGKDNAVTLRFDGDLITNRGTIARPVSAIWRIMLLSPPIALLIDTTHWGTNEEARLFATFAGGLHFAFDSFANHWQEVHRHTGISGYSIFIANNAQQTECVTSTSLCSETTQGRVCDSKWEINIGELVKHEGRHPQIFNQLTSTALAEMLKAASLAAPKVSLLKEQWEIGQPFLSLELKDKRTEQSHLPPPVSFGRFDAQDTEKILKNIVAAKGTTPGIYKGEKAKKLIRDTLAPGILSELHKAASIHALDDLLNFAMTELTLIADNLALQQDDIVRAARSFSLDWSPTDRLAELRDIMFRLRQANEIIVELATRNDDSNWGNTPVSHASWQQILSLADLYRRITGYSEQIHYRLSPVDIDVSALHEVHFIPDSSDVAAWHLDMRSAGSQVSTLHISPNGLETGDSRMWNDEELDEALNREFGFTAVDLFTVLTVLSRWPHFPSGSHICRISLESATEWIYQNVLSETIDEKDRLAEALKFLLLNQELLSEEPWTPWKTQTRKSRLLVKPLLQDSTGKILIAPHYLLMSLSVYMKYLRQGALPWKEEDATEVIGALARKRSQQNAQFEKELDALLQRSGYKTLTRIKPGDHERIGVPRISSEIDLVCALPGSNEIWLIEAKDPVSTHSAAEISRSLRKFFGEKNPKKRRKSYTDMLSLKEKELAPYVANIASALGIHIEEGDSFTLRTLFITRDVTPESYVLNAPHEARALSVILAENEGRIVL